MRTTITLDEDVAKTVREEMRSGNGKTFKEAVNELIRRGRYAKLNGTEKEKPFEIHARDLGSYPHINYDKTSELLALLDEEDFRAK